MAKKVLLVLSLALVFLGCKADFLSEQIEDILVVPAPAFSIEGGVYNADQIVEVLADLEGITIYYTLDGSDPTTESAVYTGPIELAGHGTEVVISVMVTKEGMQDSPIIRASFTIRYLSAAAPEFSHAAGHYDADINVTITTASTGADIYYTTDGSIPDENSTPYTGPVFFNQSATLNAIAILEGIPSSDVTSAQYVIDYNKVVAPSFDLAPGTYTTDQTLTITTSTPGATIYYTIDGSIPTTGSFDGTGSSPLVVPVAGHGTYMAINAFAVGAGLDDSDVTSGTYSIEYPAAEPVAFSLPEGTYATPQSVTLSTTTPAATIYYTTNGSIPTTSSTVYSAPIQLSLNGTYTFRALASAAGMVNSPVTSVVYNINVVPPVTVTEVKKLPGSSAKGSYFAGSVDISGDYVIAGAAHENSDLGAAYVYQRNSGGTNNWGEIKRIVPTDSYVSGQEFFGSQVTIEAIGGGSTYYAGVSEHADDQIDSWSGAGFVFDRDSGGAGNWGQLAKLIGSTALAQDRNGIGFAFTDNFAFIGANAHNSWQGAVYIFSTTGWAQTNALYPTDATSNDGFGYRFDVENDILIVGSAGHDGQATDAGAIYIYYRNYPSANAWGLYSKKYASDGSTNTRFGSGVSMSGSYAVIGAYYYSTQEGDAYILHRDQGGANNWGEVTKLTALDVAPGDGFGYSVAMSGDYAVVGAPYKNGGAGAVYMFERNYPGTNAWGHVTTITAGDPAANENFGYCVAIDGNTIVVGANRDNTYGSAYVFTF